MEPTIKVIKFASCFDCPYIAQSAYDIYHRFRRGHCRKLKDYIKLGDKTHIYEKSPLPNEADLSKGEYLINNYNVEGTYGTD